MFNSQSYRKAFDDYAKDVKQLAAIGSRLVANAESCKKEPELKTVIAQLDKVLEGHKEAKARYLDAIDAVDAGIVQRFRGLCAYCLATGQPSAGISYLYGECQAFDAAKGDYQKRRALFSSIGVVAESVASAIEGRKDASSGSSIIDEFESITDPEARTRFDSQNRDQLLAAYDARNQNTHSETQNASN